MGTYNVHGGHNRIVPGAGHYLDEVTEDRRITAGLLQGMVEKCIQDSALLKQEATALILLYTSLQSGPPNCDKII